MRKFLLSLLLFYSGISLAMPVSDTPPISYPQGTHSTTASVSSHPDTRVAIPVRIQSHHEINLYNGTGGHQVYWMYMRICPVDKPNQCILWVDHVGLSSHNSYKYVKDLYVDVAYNKIGEHSVTASSWVDQNEAVSFDQKYVWVHY